MNIEIERKYLLRNADWRGLAEGVYYKQAYLNERGGNTVRVRIEGDKAKLTIKGKAGSYAYGDYATLTAGWQQVSYDFTLDAETIVCLVVMNPKKSSYSSGEDVLIDDATLTKK